MIYPNPADTITLDELEARLARLDTDMAAHQADLTAASGMDWPGYIARVQASHERINAYVTSWDDERDPDRYAYHDDAVCMQCDGLAGKWNEHDEWVPCPDCDPDDDDVPF